MNNPRGRRNVGIVSGFASKLVGDDNMEELSSRKNPSVRFMRELLRNADFRNENEMFAVEGDHLCAELSQVCAKAAVFMYTGKAAGKYPETVAKMRNIAEQCFVITEELSEYISDTKTPQGLFAAAYKVTEQERERTINGDNSRNKDARKIVVLDGVQDPGNVGTIIRTAEALGIDRVVLTGKCADIYSPKTLRASMGSALRMAVDYAENAEDLHEKLSGFTLYAAMLDKNAKRLGEVEFPAKAAVVIGSEGSGVSKEVAEICSEKLYIPIKKAESLNAAAAAAIILWEISR